MASDLNIYYGFTEAELLDMRERLLGYYRKVIAGEAFNGVSVGGKSFNRFVASIADLKRELEAINEALADINPDTYGRRITRTTARFV